MMYKMRGFIRVWIQICPEIAEMVVHALVDYGMCFLPGPYYSAIRIENPGQLLCGLVRTESSDIDVFDFLVRDTLLFAATNRGV
ncbi:MAG: hypothetical protein JW795_19765 [Chitinivibrionales bacterium]|nr:hypothetical protein [Chitinivibrionales bacterium]